jgi:hypothetical protein
MGYFREPIRRRAARAEKLALLEAARDVDLTEWEPAVGVERVARDAYVRFVVCHPERGWVGLFAAGDVLDEPDALPDAARSALRDTLRWFNRNLAVPRRLPRDAVCWFRADATPCLARLRDLIELYRLAGRPVVMRASFAPGRTVYRDGQQVAAVPGGGGRVTSSTW